MSARYRHPARAARTGGFTLVELLVTITIIAILAGIALGALVSARQIACESKTKATIAKLDQIVNRRYESYRTRRVPISTSGMTNTRNVAEARLNALWDLMRMEMPERWNDVTEFDPLVALPHRPALSERYVAAYSANGPSGDNSHAECLYMFVMTGSAEDREQFNETEIGDTDNDGWQEFLDGWGHPIYFLRWAPGFSYRTDLGFSGASEIQSGDHVNDHDPFDSRNVCAGAFKLTPLIYSFGPDEKSGIDAQGGTPTGLHFTLPDGPFADMSVGAPDGTGEHVDNIHNHHLEQR